MSPSHEVIYFNGPGRAEAIRILLQIAKADWKDTRFEFSDWPTKIKPSTPLGSVPVLKIDGIDHVQTTALTRYAGKLAGWYPEDPLEALVSDEACESLNEMMALAPKSKDPEELKKLRQEYQATTMTKYSTFLESAIQRNGGVGFAKSPCVGDLLLMIMVCSVAKGSWDHIDPKFFEAYPGITGTVDAMKANEQVKSYYDDKRE